jgi:Domain of unknown function (DUF6438)
MKSRRRVNSDVMRLPISINRLTSCLLVLLCVSAIAQSQSGSPEFKHVTITMKTEGGPCMCIQGIDLSCCPAYVVSVDENGTVKYVGVGGVKIRGEKTHSISPSTVRDLVANFLRIKFFLLQNEYYFKILPDGTKTSIDHSNATTISIDLDGKRKSVYIFFGAPDELTDLQHKLFDALQIAEYVGRA